jgi:heat-inducible transcriptional repressor
MGRQKDVSISERQRAILQIIIEEHVSSARPVASEQIVSRYGLNVSSATVRNDMVELERAGLIMQPHTSAGRVPSERGYRYFVANLMSPTTLPANEQRKIRHQFHQIEMDAEEWVRLAASVLSRTIHSAAVATAPRSTAVHLKHFELLSLSEKRVLLVLVGHDGTVTQQMLTVDETLDQEQLSDLATRLNGVLAGKTAAEIEKWSQVEANVKPLPFIAHKVLSTLETMLSRLEKPETSHLYHEGLAHMLEQPEFREPGRMQQVLELFEHGSVWSSLIPSILHQEGVQVIIGDENWGEGMGSCSVVLARYGLEDRLMGILGVVGPTRMPYSRSVSTVGYVSHLLSDMLNRAYNPPGSS